MRGSEIVRQLMIYAGQESSAVGQVDVSKTVGEMLQLLKVSVTKHAVLKADLEHNLPAAQASAAQLGQIVMNLITNASDAIGDRDGVIRVITKLITLTADPASSRALPAGNYVLKAWVDEKVTRQRAIELKDGAILHIDFPGT